MTEDKIDEYLKKHLPYRINNMLAHDLMLHRKKLDEFGKIKHSCYSDSLVVEPLFEISIIFGRSLLHFLGLGLNRKKDQIIERRPNPNFPNDLTLKSLFPEKNLCSKNDPLVQKNYKELFLLLFWADKSVAHLTSNISEAESEEQDLMPIARKSIYQLCLKYLPELDKEKIWWYTQVEKNYFL